MNSIVVTRDSFKPVAALAAALLLCLPLLAQHEQTPINIEHEKTVKDLAPPKVTFNNYSFADLKVENTYGATEKFYTATGTPTIPGDLKTVTINNEWGTLKATPCSDSTLTSCASYPLVQFSEGYGNYNFELTVTDSTGTQAKDTTTVLYIGR